MRKVAGALLAAAAIAGCGSNTNQAPPSLADGARVFASSCSGCHTLAQPKHGRVPEGGPLAGYHLTASQIESFTKAMPVPRSLGPRELQAVVAYVAHAQGAGGTSR